MYYISSLLLHVILKGPSLLPLLMRYSSLISFSHTVSIGFN